MSIQTARIRDAVEPVSSHPAVVDAQVIEPEYLDAPRALEIVLREGSIASLRTSCSHLASTIAAFDRSIGKATTES